MSQPRGTVVSSFTIIKGALFDETHAVLQGWDFSQSRLENLRRARDENTVGAKSTHWARDVSKVLNRRFDPGGRDRPLTLLAKAGCPREIWKAILLYHMTRDEFLFRDFLVGWLYPEFIKGTFRVRGEDVMTYLRSLASRKGIQWSGKWTESTTERVASGLLHMATDFGLLVGTQVKEFTSYHLPDEAFLYLLHAIAEEAPSAQRLIQADDWKMYRMDTADVERELLRLHQYQKLHYEVAGSLAQLKLPCASPAEYAEELSA